MLYSYIVRYDTGFAPNPFWGYCTLATCKPAIRRAAKGGDWIIGTGSVLNVGPGKLIYAMQVSKVLSFDDYDQDPHFRQKRPNMGGTARQRCGDNIYYRGSNGEWQQRRSRHNRDHMKHDLEGRNVLVAERFYYWGYKAVDLPEDLVDLIKRGPGHKVHTSLNLVARLDRWLEGHGPGIRGRLTQGELRACECG